MNDWSGDGLEGPAVIRLLIVLELVLLLIVAVDRIIVRPHVALSASATSGSTPNVSTSPRNTVPPDVQPPAPGRGAAAAVRAAILPKAIAAGPGASRRPTASPLPASATSAPSTTVPGATVPIPTGHLSAGTVAAGAIAAESMATRPVLSSDLLPGPDWFSAPAGLTDDPDLITESDRSALARDLLGLQVPPAEGAAEAQPTRRRAQKAAVAPGAAAAASSSPARSMPEQPPLPAPVPLPPSLPLPGGRPTLPIAAPATAASAEGQTAPARHPAETRVENRVARPQLQRPIERPVESSVDRSRGFADRARKPDRADVRVAMVVPPARPATRAGAPVDQLKERPADRNRTRLGEGGAGVAPTARVAEAQRLLARLGHFPWDADGVSGGRTEEAVRAFQRRIGAAADGRISDGLLARLRHDVQEVAARDDHRVAPTPQDRAAEVAVSPGLMGTIRAHVQRVVGPSFNGVTRPDQLRSHCRKQPETWIFDEDRDDLLFCGAYAGQAAEHRQRAQR